MKPQLFVGTDPIDNIIGKALDEHFNIQENDEGKRTKLISMINEYYGEPWRFYHTIDHVRDIVRYIHERSDNFPEDVLNELMIAAVFHDLYYKPFDKGRHHKMNDTDDEDISILNYGSACGSFGVSESDLVKRLIEITKSNKRPETDGAEMVFWDADRRILFESDMAEQIEYEQKIMKEFQFVNYLVYKQKRLEFLENCGTDNVKGLIEWVRNRRPKIGIYAGSFNPFHVGHLDVLRQAEKHFDKVIIGVGVNPEKKEEGHKDKVKKVKESVVFREVQEFSGLLTDLIDKESMLCDVSLIRGLRNGHDLEYEMNQLRFMEDIRQGDVPTVYYVCSKKNSHISSSAIRNLSYFSTKDATKYLVKDDGRKRLT